MLVQFALVWWLTKETGSATFLSTATAFAILPEILISPFPGAVVDRFCGLGIAGPVSDKFGIMIWFALAGLLCLLSSFAIFFLPLLKNIEGNNR
jgi:hypothetical protein